MPRDDPVSRLLDQLPGQLSHDKLESFARAFHRLAQDRAETLTFTPAASSICGNWSRPSFLSLRKHKSSQASTSQRPFPSDLCPPCSVLRLESPAVASHLKARPRLWLRYGLRQLSDSVLCPLLSALCPRSSDLRPGLASLRQRKICQDSLPDHNSNSPLRIGPLRLDHEMVTILLRMHPCLWRATIASLSPFGVGRSAVIPTWRRATHENQLIDRTK